MSEVATLLVCRHCDWIGTPSLYWVSYGPNRHLMANCRDCGAWLQRVPQTDDWLHLAQAVPEIGEQGVMV